MNDHTPQLHRRDFLRGAVLVGLALPLSTTLASCAAGGAQTKPSTSGAKKSANNPFGVAANSTIAAGIFNGGYGTDYVDFAAAIMDKKFKTKTTVTPITNIAQTLQPKFVAGNPPDLVDNSGANAIGISTIRSQLEVLDDVLDANNYEGSKIRDSLYTGVTKPGTIGGKATAKGKYLFLWGKEAATDYQTTAIASAIKEGGDDVRLSLENLEPGCWSKPAVQAVFKGMKKIIDAGYVKPGGAGTQFTQAQAQWSNDEAALLYPSGSWIENEM